MKTITNFFIAFLLSVFSLLNISAQEFKGYIEYKVEFESLSRYVSAERLQKNFGHTSVFYYEKGNLLQEFTGGKMEFDYLDIKTGSYYRKYRGDDTLYMLQARENEDEDLVNFEEQENRDREEILNYPCKKAVLTGRNIPFEMDFTIDFYYSDKIQLQGRRFKGIRFSLMEDVYGRLNSIPLAFAVNYPMYVLKMDAVKVEPIKDLSLADRFQEMSEGLIIKEVSRF